MLVGHIGVRSGSRGLKNKNFRLICGRPLLSWSLEALLDSGCVDEVFVSTDCPEMYEYSLKFGCLDLGLRDPALCDDLTPKFDVWQDSIRKICQGRDLFEGLVDLDCTSPLRTLGDIRSAVSLFQTSNNVDLIMSCSEARKNPYFNLVEERNDGTLFVSKSCFDGEIVGSRQIAPRVLEHVASIYVMNPVAVMERKNLWQLNVKPFMMPYERSFDIDTITDFKIVELLLNEQIKDGFR